MFTADMILATKSNYFGVPISPVGTKWLTVRSTRERCTTYRVYLNPYATPGPYWSSSVGNNWCIQKWTEDTRGFNTHKTCMYSMFLKGRRQTITKEEISRIEKVDKAEAAQTWAIPQTVPDTIFYSSLFRQQFFAGGCCFGEFSGRYCQKAESLNKKRISRKSSSHSFLSWCFRLLLFRCRGQHL